MREIDYLNDLHPDTPQIIQDTLTNESEEEIPDDPEGMRDLEDYDYANWVLENDGEVQYDSGTEAEI